MVSCQWLIQASCWPASHKISRDPPSWVQTQVVDCDAIANDGGAAVVRCIIGGSEGAERSHPLVRGRAGSWPQQSVGLPGRPQQSPESEAASVRRVGNTRV